MVNCPCCKGTGSDGGHMCAYCGGERRVSEEARDQWLEYMKKPEKDIEKTFRPIR